MHTANQAPEAALQITTRQSQMHDHRHCLPLRAFAVGMMHGMAGSAGLILLSLGPVHSLPIGLTYIFLFGLGSLTGMALLSVAIAIPLRLSVASRVTWLHNALTAAFGVFSCLLGTLIMYRIGITSGLSV